jgi:hypothetical protein
MFYGDYDEYDESDAAYDRRMGSTLNQRLASEEAYKICEVYRQTQDECAVKLKAFLDEHPGAENVNVNWSDGGEQASLALHQVASEGWPKCVRMLLDHGADVHARGEYGSTALNLACGPPNEDIWWGIEHETLHLECVQMLIEAKSDVNTASDDGYTPVHYASGGNPKILQLLIDNHANMNVRTRDGRTPAMIACSTPCLTSLQLLIDNNVDPELQQKIELQPLWNAIMQSTGYPEELRLVPFALLCDNADPSAVEIAESYGVTEAKVTACIEEYKEIQAYIDEFHCALNCTLSTRVELDSRIGMGKEGIYHEPLERVLEYMGLSMKKDQVVNTTIDGVEDVKRALIPSQLLNAKHWHGHFAKQQRRTRLKQEVERLQKQIRESMEQLECFE